MRSWHQRRSADLMLRAGGATILYGAGLSGTMLKAAILSRAAGEASAFDLLTGMILFDLAALGAAALVLGKHLFARITISDRWVEIRKRR